MSSTVDGDKPRRARIRKPTAIGNATSMDEKVGRLGALYEGLDTKVDDLSVKVNDHIVNSAAQYQDLKNTILASQVKEDTTRSIWSTVIRIAAYTISQVVIIGAAVIGASWFHGSK